VKKDSLYIVIPAYNEQENIESVVNDWYPVVESINKKSNNEKSRLVIIDDGSKDDTYKILKKLAKTRPYLEPITKENAGHGATVLYGYRHAIKKKADYIFQTDSDGQTLPSEFKQFWDQREKYSAIIGHRNHRRDGLSRIFVTKTLKLVLKMIFGVSVTDANTPFRLMKRELLEKYIDKIPENFNLSNVMLSVLFVSNNEKVKFIPITFRPRQGGVNSINLPKITKIGIQAVKDFRVLKKSLKVKGDHKLIKNSLIGLAIFGMAFTISMMSPNNILKQNGIPGTDSSVFQTIGMRMHYGDMPYKDIFDHKGPLLYVINYVALGISYHHGVWMVDLVALTVTIALLYKIARLKVSKKISLLATFVVSTLFFEYFSSNMTECYALPFITYSLYVFLNYFLNHKLTKIQTLFVGISFGAILMLRPNMCAVWVVFALAYLVEKIKQKDVKQLLKTVGIFIGGTVLMMAPFLIWLGMNGALQDFYDVYIKFNILYSSQSKSAHFDLTGIYDSATENKVIASLTFADHIIVMIAIAGAIWALKNKEKASLLNLLAIVLTLITISLSGRIYYHYAMPLVPVLVFPMAFLIMELNKIKIDKKMILVVMAWFLIVNVIPDWNVGVQRFFSAYRDRSIDFLDTAYSNNRYAVIKYVKKHSSKEDKVAVYGNYTWIYYFTKRLPASRYIYTSISSVDESIYKDFCDDVKENKPQLFVINKYDLAKKVDLKEMLIELGYKDVNFKDKNFSDNPFIIYSLSE